MALKSARLEVRFNQREGAVLERGRCATRLLPRGFTSPGVSFGLGRLSLAAKVLCWSLWLSARQLGLSRRAEEQRGSDDVQLYLKV